jgi:hypothetical protein
MKHCTNSPAKLVPMKLKGIALAHRTISAQTRRNSTNFNQKAINMASYRMDLEEYRGKRIIVTGVFDKFGNRYDHCGREVTTALIQAVEMDGRPIASHCHVQFADNFCPLDMTKGDRVSFEAIVMQYKRRLAVTNEDGLLVEADYGLYHPSKIRLLDREMPSYKAMLRPDEIEEMEEQVEVEDKVEDVPAFPTQQETTPPPADPLAKLAAVKQFAVDMGGWDSLQRMIDLLRP